MFLTTLSLIEQNTTTFLNNILNLLLNIIVQNVYNVK